MHLVTQTVSVKNKAQFKIIYTVTMCSLKIYRPCLAQETPKIEFKRQTNLKDYIVIKRTENNL